MNRRSVGALVLTVVGVFLLVSCQMAADRPAASGAPTVPGATSQPRPSQTPVPSAAVAPPRAAATTPTSAPAEKAGDGDEAGWIEVDDITDPRVSIPATSPAQREAVAVAARAATAFARPTEPGRTKQWRAGCLPLLSARGKADYAGIDPYKVPYTRTQGLPRLVPLGEETHLVQLAVVDTDAGPVQVYLTLAPSGRWLVDQITFPGGRR